MDRPRRRAEQESERVLERARTEFAALDEPWDNYLIDVELIATLLFDLGIQRVPDLRAGDRLYAGFLDADAKLIAIEATHHPHRQRFSIAHEIGHFVLHYLPTPASDGHFACTNSDMEVDGAPRSAGSRLRHFQQEAEANRFAGSLLMPARSVEAMCRATGGRIPTLAKHFNVSPKAMEIRLDQLGLPYTPINR